MIVYEMLYWGSSIDEVVREIKTNKYLGKDEGSYYGFYNDRGASVYRTEPCWRGYKCFGYTDSSKPYRLGSVVRSVSGANGTFDITEMFSSYSEKPSYVIAKYVGCATRIDVNTFAVRG